MIFQSYFSSLVKSGSQGASEAYDKVSQMSKPAIDKAISKAVEIKQAASRKIDSAMQTAHSIEKSASQQVSKAYQQTAVMLKTAEKQLKTLQARSKDTFSRRHLDDLVEQCPKLKKARDEAKKLSEEPAKTKFKAAEQFVGGDYNKDYLSKTSEDKLGATREFKIGVERTKEEAYLVFKSGELKQTVLGKESKRSAELKYDAKAHEASAKVGAEISGAVYKIEDKGSIGHGLVVVKGDSSCSRSRYIAMALASTMVRFIEGMRPDGRA